MASENTAISAGAALAVGSGVVTSLQHNQSMLNSTLPQIVAGEFTLYISDIVSVGGILIGLSSLSVAIYRIRSGK